MDFTFKDAMDVALRLGDNVNSLWNFYLTVQLALVGALLAISLRLKTGQKIVATIAFLIFVIVNWTGLMQQYYLLNAAIAELKLQVYTVDLKNDSLKAIIHNVDFSNRYWVTTVAHAISDIIVLCLIWFNRLRT
jgi:hypothetical protein